MGDSMQMMVVLGGIVLFVVFLLLLVYFILAKAGVLTMVKDLLQEGAPEDTPSSRSDGTEQRH